jgi:enoyl-CoA hydratase/carnithine racemase
VSSLVTYRLEEGVGIISLNRPEKHNALSNEMSRASREAWDWARDTEEVRVIVIRGEGKSFCAGRDTTQLGQREGNDSDYSFVRRAATGRIHGLYEDKPVIAAVRGYAIGGGFEQALAADIRVGATDAKLSLPEINYGILPDTGGTQLLNALVGPGRTKVMTLTGSFVDARTAYEWGIFDFLVEPDELDDKAFELAKEIASKSPLAVRLGKTLVDQMYTGMIANGIKQELLAQTALFTSQDYQEARAAIREKRKPEFTGR